MTKRPYTTHERRRSKKTVIRIGNRVKQTYEMELEQISGTEIDAKLELVQELIPLGLTCVAEESKNEVEQSSPVRGTAAGKVFRATSAGAGRTDMGPS